MVITWDQGTILDRIDYNMEAVVKHTKTGVSSSWKRAEKSQKNARPMCCIIIDGSKQY
jgi:syntaxin 16